MARPPGENRRRSVRLQHELPVAYRSIGSFITDWATNISQGGVFINTRKPLAVGTSVKLLIQLPGTGVPFDISGRVTRVNDWDNKHNVAPGMAIEFTELDAATFERIQAFIDRLRRDLDPP
jgi:type IV pilus assembly protein PilZ